ncbi:MAG: hypothetical protein ABI847_21485 [Anaerolineales bacterium]
MEENSESDTEWVLARFRQSDVTEESRRQALERRAPRPKRQDLLYLECSSTALTSSVLGMTLVRDGELLDGPGHGEEWPYSSVLAAIRDGWRVIKFPELALLMVEERTISLGCQFILEKWS